MALSPEQRTLRARAGAHTQHARHDSREITANARAGFFAKFLHEVDALTPGLTEVERLRRAEHLMRAHMTKLALKSSIARSKRVLVAEAKTTVENTTMNTTENVDGGGAP